MWSLHKIFHTRFTKYYITPASRNIISHPLHKIFHTSICQIFHKNNKMSSLCDGCNIVGLFRQNTFICQNSFRVRFFAQNETKCPIMISSPDLRLRLKSPILEISGMGEKKLVDYYFGKKTRRTNNYS